MNELVSIIVPCFKQAYFLKDSLQSVLDQSYINWECIIVNDGSPDNTAIVAHEWCAKDIRFKYVYQDNAGLSSARNTGIKYSMGEFILPLDADDVLHPDYLNKTVSVLRDHPAIGIVSCYSTFFSGTTNNIVNQLKPIGDNVTSLLFVNQLVATSLFRKMCWEQVGGYDEIMKKGFEDWDFWLSCTKQGWTYKIIPEFLFYYRKAKKSMLTNTIQHHAEEVKQFLFIKHKELYIRNFENCMEVLFFELKVQRTGHDTYKNSQEYKIGKLILQPYRWLTKLILKSKKT